MARGDGAVRASNSFFSPVLGEEGGEEGRREGKREACMYVHDRANYVNVETLKLR